MKVDITNTAQAQAAEVSRHFAAPLGSDAALQGRLRDAEETVTDLRAQLNAEQVQNADLITRVEVLETELEVTRDKLQAAGANVDELNAEIAALKTATTSAKGKGK